MNTLPATNGGTQQSAAAPLPSGPVFRTLTVQEHLTRMATIHEILGKVMKDSTHYGKIPGCGDKPSLLKPGAEILCATFGYSPRVTQCETIELPAGHREVRVTVSLTNHTGQVIAEGLGSCSTMESNYRWRNPSLKCPKCGKETIIKGKEEYGGGWLCYPKKGGCNAKFIKGDTQIEQQPLGKIENPDIADTYNTVLKMAKKRAFVDATLTATAASDMFTQDVEDLVAEYTVVSEEAQEAPQQPARQRDYRKSAQQQKAPQAQTQAATAVLLADRIHKMLAAFESVGVRLGQIEEYLGHSAGDCSEKDVEALQGVFRDIKAAPNDEERAKRIGEFFPTVEG